MRPAASPGRSIPVLAPESEGCGRLGDGVRGVAVGVGAARVLPHRPRDPVEDGVARHLERTGQRDRAVAGGLEVAEGLRADGQAARAVVDVVQVEARIPGGGGADHLVGRPRRELTLIRVGRQRLAVDELLELLLAHAPDPDGGVVGGVARHREHLACAHVDDDGSARLPAVALRLRSADGRHQLLLDDGLQLGVDAGHHVVARLRVLLLERPGHVACRVDGKGGDARLAPERLVVDALEARASDDVGAAQPVERRRVALLRQLLLGDGPRYPSMCAALTLKGAGYSRTASRRAETPGKSRRRSMMVSAVCWSTSLATGTGW